MASVRWIQMWGGDLELGGASSYRLIPATGDVSIALSQYKLLWLSASYTLVLVTSFPVKTGGEAGFLLEDCWYVGPVVGSS